MLKLLAKAGTRICEAGSTRVRKELPEMKLRKYMSIKCAIIGACLLLPLIACSQTSPGIVGFWTQVSGTLTHDYAFSKDGRFESKLYGSIVYQIHYGTYTVNGDQLTLSAPETSPETYRWKIVIEYSRPTLKLTDSFGAVVPFYKESFDHRYVTSTLIPYDRASLPGFWIVSHGRMHWEYAFTPDGKFQSKRVGDAVNETVRGTYIHRERPIAYPHRSGKAAAGVGLADGIGEWCEDADPARYLRSV